MNPSQTRLLLETEFHFYRLQEGPSDFERALRALGYKPQPDLRKLDDLALKKLNARLRSILRKPSQWN